MQRIKQLIDNTHCMACLFSCLYIRFKTIADDSCGLYMPLLAPQIIGDEADVFIKARYLRCRVLACG